MDGYQGGTVLDQLEDYRGAARLLMKVGSPMDQSKLPWMMSMLSSFLSCGVFGGARNLWHCYHIIVFLPLLSLAYRDSN